MTYMIPPAVEGYRSGLSIAGTGQPSLSQMMRNTCGCMARYIAARKKNFDTPTSNDVMFNALDKCLGAK